MAFSMASSASATSTNRVMALVDIDCFYVQVEERDNPALKGIPAAVVRYKMFQGIWVVIAVNCEARAKGVSTKIREDAAKALCPEIQLVRVPEFGGKSDLTKYMDAGGEVVKVLSEFSSCVERVMNASVDEEYIIDLTEAVEVRLAELSSQETASSRGERILESLDMEAFSTNYVVGHDSTSCWFESIKRSEIPSIDDIKLAIGAEIVGKMRESVYQKTQFRCSAGIAPDKVAAKLVCDINKPNKQTILPNEYEAVSTLGGTTKIEKVRWLGGKLGGRRGTNAPKTTEEAGQDAIRKGKEKKRRKNDYGEGGSRDRDHRSGSRLPGGQSRKKRSESSTLPGNEASKNSVEKPEPSSSTGNPVFGPPSWGSTQSKSPCPNLPPRLQANRNRLSNLAQDNQDDRSRQPNKSLQNPSKDETVTADTGESVKNIFQEYLRYKKFDDTLHWIKKRFPGNQIDDFINELSRQVSENSKEEEQKCAGSFVRLLIKDNQIPKEAVLRVMAQGVMKDLPDIVIDSPMATSYLAQFLVEMFAEDNNLDWLVQVGDNLIDSDEGDSAWKLLAVNSLNLLKLRKNEEFVQTSFGQTERKNGIPIDEIPWLQDKSIDTLTEQMQMLSPNPMLNSESSDETGGHIFQMSQTPK